MKAVKLREGIYWVGAIDWSIRNFHGYITDQGTTYNAYLIIDEKITLIDTVKAPFAEEMLERIRSIVPVEKIDVVISNHVEMDHSGSLPRIMELCPNASIYTSTPNGVKGLTAHYGASDKYIPAASGDQISLGKRTLHFTGTPMLHWPDNMVTYCPEEKILFSNDAFGQHLATTERLETQLPLHTVLEGAKGYYANIIMCYGRQAAAAWKVVKGLDVEMIAPSHGLVWTDHISDILDAYETWSSKDPETGAVIVYDSMWHSTEKMALTITDAFKAAGVEAHLFDMKANDWSKIMPFVLTNKYIAVGSPTLNNQMMPTVAAFLCYLKGLSPKNREVFAFGSYGWGGQSIGQIAKELEECGFHKCLDDIRIQYIPSQEQLDGITQKVTELIGK